MSNLLIGATDIYDWSKVKVWANSARDSGYDGDIVLLTYRITNPEEYVREAQKLGIDVLSIDYDPWVNEIQHNVRGRDTQSHQMRFFHMWQYLQEHNGDYEYVITTDVRDVYFQRNPFHFVENFYPELGDRLLASSEGIRYQDELWGLDNMRNGFGPIVTQYAMPWEIYNVGVMAGRAEQMKNMFFKIYNMTVGRYIPSDQSAYNIFVNLTDSTQFVRLQHDYGWACQCGTTMDPDKQHYLGKLVGPPPQIVDGKACTSQGDQYVIVHQYDRVSELKTNIEGLY